MNAVDLAYEYCALQLVPSALSDDCLTIGVVLHARAAEYLDLRVDVAPERWAAQAPGLDVAMAARIVADLALICRGGPAGGPVGLLPAGERFHWLAAPRSAVIRPAEVRGGRCQDPQATLERLFALGLLRPSP